MDKEIGDEDVGRTTDGQSDVDDSEIPNGAELHGVGPSLLLRPQFFSPCDVRRSSGFLSSAWSHDSVSALGTGVPVHQMDQ